MDDVPYESIVEQSNDGILVAQNGEIVYANERLQELTGYAEATLVGAPKTMLVTDDDAALVEQYHGARTNDEDAPAQYEVTFETRSGDRIPVGLSVNKISRGGEPAIVAFCREITNQKEREATLDDLRREYESVFDHVQDPLFLLDVDENGTVRFQRFNDREEAFTGRSTEEVRGKTPTEVFGDETGLELAANYRECIERQETLVYEEELDLTDETTIWQIKLTPIVVDGTVERIVGSGREITELKNRERELEQAKTRLQALLDEAPDAIAIHDADGDILDINDQNVENLGYTRDELLEMNVTDFEVELDQETAQETWAGMDIGETLKVERTHQRRDGSTFPTELWVSKIEVLGEPQYLALGRDVTERKERERELSRFRAFVENTSDVITTISGDGTVEYVSPASSRVSGHEPEELIGAKVLEHVHPADREAISEQLAELTATPDSRATAEYRFRHDDGSWMWVESTGVNRLGDPKIEGLVLVSRDITERKQYEERLDRLHDATRALVQADTHASIAEIAVETARDTLDLPITGLWLHDETENILRPTAVTDAGRDLLGEPPVFDPGTNLSWEAFQAQEVKMFDDVASQPGRHNPETPLRSEIILPLGEHGVMNIGATERATFDETDRSLAHILAANVEAALTRADQRQELARQTERLDLALEGGQMGVWDWNVQTDEVTFDERWAEMLGHSLNEIEPHLNAWEKRAHPEDLPDAEAALEAHFAGETDYYKCDHRMQTKSGDWIWVRDTGEVVERGDDGDPVRAVGTHLDITERKRREQELKESKGQIAEQNNALESFTDIVTDAERTVDQQITDLLDLGASYLDLDIGILSEIDGVEYMVRNVVDPAEAIEPGDTFDLTDTYCSLVYDADGPVSFHSAVDAGVKDHPAYREQGIESYIGVPVFVDDHRYGTLNFSRPESRKAPITDAEESFVRIMAQWVGTELTRQQRQEELERTSQFLQDSQEVAKVGGWEVSLQSERVRWSDELYRIHGLPLDANPTPEEAIEFYHPDDRGTIREAFDRLTTEGEPYDLELRLVTADNEVCWVRTRGEPRYEDDEIVAVHGTFQDITERKEREQELQRQNGRLNEFAGVISHDLRNPLNVAQARATILQQRADDELQEHLTPLVRSLDRMESIIEDTLTLARQGETVGEMNSIPVVDLIGKCWAGVEAGEATLEIEDEFTLRGDHDRLRHVFENLFRNAVEHAGEDVTVRVGRCGENCLYVEDDGPGIPPGDRDAVFEPGHTSAAGGTGFGLTIVKRIAEAHGWEVAITDGRDGGARFEFDTPGLPVE
ncbi:PAS domain S-box protein [Halorientalis pallida]|nr:PAS domain S-box protein [Halorientalis pallida]